MLWSCSDISVVYRLDDGSQTTALHEITLAIRPGERIVIVGPNGSGKSTLALLIAGLIPPSSGSVVCEGAPADGPTGAMIFQSPDDNLLGGTVREEIQLCLEHTIGTGDLDQATNDVLSQFAIAALADRSTAQLSGGEKQIVALAAAFASGRRLIVLDEPTSHLDPPGKRLLWRNLLAACEGDEQPAIIVVTQYLDEINHFDRLIALESGSIAFDGSPIAWTGTQAIRYPTITFPKPTHDAPVLSARNLGQIEMPGWPLPTNPVRDISVKLKRGEAIALCGPIGAGKTTLGFLLAGLLPKHAGDRQVTDGSPVMLIQFPERQIFCRTVEDEVAYGLTARGVNREEALRRSHQALREVSLDPAKFAQRDPFSLSGGQKRRVMLATAAVLDAPLSILDEPQAALDDDGLSVLSRLCASWLGRGASYILISHDLEFLRSLTTRVLVLDKGLLRFDGGWPVLAGQSKLLEDIGFVEP